MEQGSNPSQPNQQQTFTPTPQKRGFSGGINWIGTGWDLLKEGIFKWIGIIIIYVIINAIITLLLSLIPIIGSIAASFFTAIIVAGIAVIAHKQYDTGQIDIDLLFSGFKNGRYISLIGAYCISILIIFIGFIIALAINWDLISTMISLVNDSDTNSKYYLQVLIENNFSSFILFFIILLIFSLISVAISWFAPALILINGYKAIPAIKTSFTAVIKNLSGGFVYFILLSILTAISAIPFGIGLFITIPLSYVAQYASYRDIFYLNNIEEQNSNYTGNNDNSSELALNSHSSNKTYDNNIVN
ncbi:BPSS1780 family membrane protein [Proteus myxofaciens]|uniref:Putative transmembrane protein n=1 Tax=Proteus myxofaciens ATCC 19692 TaxID=1354337 RepID=A0A198FG84_9GAMM|nr:BPSS1780 family membrane protein [Proteus myxofaciens]OAT23424.1 putative transmembrane protein [Proteus myxofaciens ATCC 19692]